MAWPDGLGLSDLVLVLIPERAVLGDRFVAQLLNRSVVGFLVRVALVLLGLVLVAVFPVLFVVNCK